MNTSDIRYLVNTLDPKGIPVVTPAGVLGGHLDAMKFCEHIPQEEYPAGALAAAPVSYTHLDVYKRQLHIKIES